MRLVKFEMLNGQPLWLNPDQVVKVSTVEMGRTRIAHASGLNDVKQSLTDVVRLLTLRSMPDENG